MSIQNNLFCPAICVLNIPISRFYLFCLFPSFWSICCKSEKSCHLRFINKFLSIHTLSTPMITLTSLRLMLFDIQSRFFQGLLRDNNIYKSIHTEYINKSYFMYTWITLIIQQSRRLPGVDNNHNAWQEIQFFCRLLKLGHIYWLV